MMKPYKTSISDVAPGILLGPDPAVAQVSSLPSQPAAAAATGNELLISSPALTARCSTVWSAAWLDREGDILTIVFSWDMITIVNS